MSSSGLQWFRGMLLAVTACTGCAVRHPALQPWRLVEQNARQILIPPDVTATDLAQRTFVMDVAIGHGSCRGVPGVIAIQMYGRRAKLTVTRDSLASQPAGWLANWASQIEEQGCLKPGEGLKLAGRVAESVPLESVTAFHLLHSDDGVTGEVDMGIHTGIQMTSPLWRETGLGLMAEGAYGIAGRGYSIQVTGKSTENVLGYETTLYAIRPRPGKAGYTILPVRSDRHVQGATESRPLPSVNYLKFPSEAAFYGLLYKTGQTDFTALVIAARSPAELDQRVRRLEASATCDKDDGAMCVAIPRDVAVNPMVAVTMNGVEILVGRGANLSNAIRTAGEPRPNDVLPHLRINRPWNGRLVPVRFDRDDAEILRLILSGGEVVSWQ